MPTSTAECSCTNEDVFELCQFLFPSILCHFLSILCIFLNWIIFGWWLLVIVIIFVFRRLANVICIWIIVLEGHWLIMAFLKKDRSGAYCFVPPGFWGALLVNIYFDIHLPLMKALLIYLKVNHLVTMFFMQKIALQALVQPRPYFSQTIR